MVLSIDAGYPVLNPLPSSNDLAQRANWSGTKVSYTIDNVSETNSKEIMEIHRGKKKMEKEKIFSP